MNKGARKLKAREKGKRMSMGDATPFWLVLFVYVLLASATLCVYWQVVGHEFINLDDNRYVTRNYRVQAGLTWKNLIWAFRSIHASNWHPLTWLSHMLDCHVYGLAPAGHHATSLLLHIASTLLLLEVLRSMTNSVSKSAVVATLFALHPLHVESVAWVAERKDVLSTFFWMLTMYGYIRYARRPCTKRYLPVFAALALGLMAKPMLVTLPFVLLLMDYWPLGRLDAKEERRADIGAYWNLVREKSPLFVLSAAFCVVTFLVQKHGGAVQTLEHVPLGSRIANALVSYVHYVVKMIWPAHLAVYYPYPSEGIPAWQIAGAALLLACITVIIFRQRRRQPYMIVGWLWYLGTLVPVIGIVQVGGQAMADRYTYVPSIGLFIAVVWAVPVIVAKWTHRRTVLSVVTAIVVLMLVGCTWLQLRHWKDSRSLFESALRVTAGNQLAHNQLGLTLSKRGQTEQAIHHFRQALEITPQFVDAYVNLGNAYKDQGNIEKAAAHYRQALQLAPHHPTAKNNLGIILAIQGNTSEALSLFAEVLQIDPDDVRAHNNMGITLATQGKFAEAIDHFSRALETNPHDTSARSNLQKAQQNLIRHGTAP